MKIWALLPIFVEVALALSSGEAYKRHMDRKKHHHHHGKNGTNVSDCSPGTPHHNSSAAPPYNTPYNIPTNTPSHTPKNGPKSTPTTTSSTTPPATTNPSGNGGGDSTSQSDIQAYLDAHNTLRAKHHADALTWSSTLASAAATWAKRCVFEHSGGKVGPYGENLAAGSGDFGIPAAIKLWADEESEYDPKNPKYSHYTQMVWKATSQIGCARASCNLSNFPSEYWPIQFYVCEYNPPGNVIGEFAQNVQ